MQEKLAADTCITPNVDVCDQEMLFQSYHTGPDIHHHCWWYHFHQMELEATFRDINEAADEVYGNDEDGDEADTFTGSAGSEEE